MQRCVFLSLLMIVSREALASSPVGRPLVAQIAYSRAIAIGEIKGIEPLPKPRFRISAWRPNTEVAVRVTERLRGTCPDLLTTQIYAEKGRPWKAGDKVFLFIRKIDGRKAAMFEAAQGFHAVAEIQSISKDAAASARIYKAVSRLIQLEDHSQDTRTPYHPRFSEKGQKVLIDLMADKNVTVRRFAVRCLYDLKVTQNTGHALIAAFADEKQIRETAAYALIRQKHKPATAAIANLARSLPHQSVHSTHQEAMEFLAHADAAKYGYGAVLKKAASKNRVHDLFPKSFAAIPSSFSLWFRFDVDKNGKFKLIRYRKGVTKDEAQAFAKTVKLPNSMIPAVPFSCEIHLRSSGDIQVSIY